MTVLWRIARARHDALDGEGARLFGGRWNSPGRPMVYLSEHPALATLEVRVHLDVRLSLLPPDYALFRITAPKEVSAETAPLDAARRNPARFGDEWLAEGGSALLWVPSVVAPESWNALLNPRHADAAAFQRSDPMPFDFDRRLFVSD